MAICDPAICTGCAACANVCPATCITMQPDEEGFLCPQIDESHCIHCRLCEKRCPVNVSLYTQPSTSNRTPLAVYAAQAKDLPIRLASSSGGIFTLLARQILAKSGVVYGVAWDLPNYGAKFAAARNEEELVALRGSKYVQTAVGSTYRDIKVDLECGTPVLFSGTPCQVAALRSVLGKDYDNLLTVEVICHAVPSPLAFRRYLEEREEKADSKIARISCRSKVFSWTRYEQALEFHSTACAYLRPFYRDPYLRGFICDVYNRPSCAQCSFKNLRSGADITLGDYWGIKKVIPSLYDDRGTSAVLVNTSRGASAFAALSTELDLASSTFQDVAEFNPALVKSTPSSKKRALFFGRLRHATSFEKLSLSLSRLPVRFWVFLFLGAVKRALLKFLK